MFHVPQEERLLNHVQNIYRNAKSTPAQGEPLPQHMTHLSGGEEDVCTSIVFSMCVDVMNDPKNCGECNAVVQVGLPPCLPSTLHASCHFMFNTITARLGQ